MMLHQYLPVHQLAGRAVYNITACDVCKYPRSSLPSLHLQQAPSRPAYYAYNHNNRDAHTPLSDLDHPCTSRSNKTEELKLLDFKVRLGLPGCMRS